MRRDILTWVEAQAAAKDIARELSQQVETEIKLLIAAGRVSPCCLCNFRSVRNKYMNEVWPERLEKKLLRQDKARRKGPVWSRHR